jgi:hypothetical protein
VKEKQWREEERQRDREGDKVSEKEREHEKVWKKMREHETGRNRKKVRE